MKTRTVTQFKDCSPIMPIEADKFIAYWQTLVNEIPEEYRQSALISFEVESAWGDSYLEVIITYERPETRKESKERRNAVKEAKDRRLSSDEQTYELLKRKLGK